jgi:membrane protease YdiL (CAAX protease family)
MGDAVAATVIGIVVSSIVGGLVLGIAGADTSDDLALWALGLLQIPLWVGLAGVPIWASVKKGTGSLRQDYGLEVRPWDVPVGLVVGFGCQLLFAVAAPPVYRALSLDPDKINSASQELADKAHDPFGVVCLFLMVVVGAAVVEELCYRGLWMRSAIRRLGVVGGIALSSVVFGLVHFELYALPLLALFGAVLGTLAARSGRLGPAIWAHVAFNLTAVVDLLRK